MYVFDCTRSFRAEMIEMSDNAHEITVSLESTSLWNVFLSLFRTLETRLKMFAQEKNRQFNSRLDYFDYTEQWKLGLEVWVFWNIVTKFRSFQDTSKLKNTVHKYNYAHSRL